MGASIGAGVGKGGAGITIGLNGNMSRSEGSGNGSGATHVETIIQGDAGVDFASGDDTTLKGAQIIGDSVVGTVGGDLAIISEQDTYNESRKQSSSGGSASVGWTIGAGGSSVGGSYNSQNQKGNAEYASVDDQSGIYASDSGFDITVGGNTGLVGSVIASEADPENNALTTGSITTRDIENSMSYESTTKGFGGEFTYARNPGNADKNANAGSVSPSLPMKENGDDHGTTKSAIAEGSIVITNEESQLAKTGQTAEEAVAELDRDTDNAHDGALERPLSLEELFEKQAELAEAAGLAGKAVAQTVGDVSDYMYKKTNGDPRWDEGGIYKAIMQGIGSALVGQLGNGEGLSAALGTMASQLAAGKVSDFAEAFADSLTDDPAEKKLLTNLIANAISAGIGYAVGGESGSTAASNMDRNNRQLHPRVEIKWIMENAAQFALEMGWTDDINDISPDVIDLAMRVLMQQGLTQVDKTANENLHIPENIAAFAGEFLSRCEEMVILPSGQEVRAFTSTKGGFDEHNDYYENYYANPWTFYQEYYNPENHPDNPEFAAWQQENADIIKWFTGNDIGFPDVAGGDSYNYYIPRFKNPDLPLILREQILEPSMMIGMNLALGYALTMPPVQNGGSALYEPGWNGQTLNTIKNSSGAYEVVGNVGSSLPATIGKNAIGGLVGNNYPITTTAGGGIVISNRNLLTSLGGLNTDVLYHAVTKEAFAESMLNSGIDEGVLGEENRFGKGFYLAEDPKTGKAETIYHGSIPTGAVDFEVDLSKMKVLDFSDPATAARWGYDPDADYEHNTLVAEQARAAGFNTIGYPSLRDKGGKNYVVLSDYKELLRPKSYTPFK